MPVIVPVPVPFFDTVRPTESRAKLAVTVVAASTVRSQGAVPLQPPPDQPTKLLPVRGVAVSVTSVPWS